MQRREFLALASGAAAAWPFAAESQPKKVPVIGGLVGGVARSSADSTAAFRRGLKEGGKFEEHEVLLEVRGSDQTSRLPALAVELVRRSVDLIHAQGNANAAQAAKMATTTIPIVFSNGGDPVKLGLVASMNRPGGNVTGISFNTSALVAKRLGLLRELVPQAKTIGFLTNPTNLVSETDTADMRAAARTIGQEIVVLEASTPEGIDDAFESATRQNIGALIVDVDSFFAGRSTQFVLLAARYRLPVSYGNRATVAAGGLMSYADDRLDSRRLAGSYAGRILRGEKPENLPVLQPTKFELVFNLRTARILGLTIPPNLLAIADEAID